MFNISLPLPLLPASDKDWIYYRDKAAAAGAKRVFLIAPFDTIVKRTRERYPERTANLNFSPDFPDLEYYTIWSEIIIEKIQFFAETGIETGFWMGHTIGHGGALSGEDKRYQPLTGSDGKTAKGSYCPLDANFLEYYEKASALLAGSGLPLIIYDDDFRLNRHGGTVATGCFCALHLDQFAKTYGKKLSALELYDRAFLKGDLDIRKVWLQVCSDSLYNFASQMEKSIHSVNPNTRIGLCTAMTLWSSEGVSMEKLLTTFAGNTRPYLRTIGAPYWSSDPINTAWITELTRLQRKWLHNTDVEIAAEGDTFPHTRYRTGTTAYKAFHEGLLVSALPSVQSYAFHYTQPPERDTAYIDILTDNRDRFKTLYSIFPENWLECGVEPIIPENGMSSMQHFEGFSPLDMTWPDEPAILKLLSQLSIPIAFSVNGPTLLSGESVKNISLAEIKSAIKRGALIDGSAAAALLEMGIDIGVESAAVTKSAASETFANHPFSGPFSGETIQPWTGGEGLYFNITPSVDSETIGHFMDSEGNEWPSGFAIDLGDKGKIVLICFDFYKARNGMQLVLNEPRQHQWCNAFEWLNKKSIPVRIIGEQSIRTVIRQSDNCKEYISAFQNCRVDTLNNPRLSLNMPILTDTLEILLPGSSAIRKLSASEYTYKELVHGTELTISISLHTLELFALRFKTK
ncbi:MAG: hypothetical protein JNL74_14950 [Fibrobacteres bacterium]|nr:hypothetical protein [Fibrobacterota bacterium]